MTSCKNAANIVAAKAKAYGTASLARQAADDAVAKAHAELTEADDEFAAALAKENDPGTIPASAFTISMDTARVLLHPDCTTEDKTKALAPVSALAWICGLKDLLKNEGAREERERLSQQQTIVQNTDKTFIAAPSLAAEAGRR